MTGKGNKTTSAYIFIQMQLRVTLFQQLFEQNNMTFNSILSFSYKLTSLSVHKSQPPKLKTIVLVQFQWTDLQSTDNWLGVLNWDRNQGPLCHLSFFQSVLLYIFHQNTTGRQAGRQPARQASRQAGLPFQELTLGWKQPASVNKIPFLWAFSCILWTISLWVSGTTSWASESYFTNFL